MHRVNQLLEGKTKRDKRQRSVGAPYHGPSVKQAYWVKPALLRNSRELNQKVTI